MVFAAYACRLSSRFAPAALTSVGLAAASASERSTVVVASHRWSTAALRPLTTSSSVGSAASSAASTTTAATAAATTTSRAATTAAAKVVAPTAATAAASSTSLLAWYEGHLQSRPVVTKMFTGTLLWGLGDAVAQVVPAAAVDSRLTTLDYDLTRTGRACLFGFAIHAPASHLHFNFLEWMTVKAGVTGLKIPVFKAFMEQFVYWSWFSNGMYHGAMGAMQGRTPEQIYNRLADVLWETQKAQWVFWIPIQLLNFRFVPVRHQLNVVLLTSVVWTALLSAWYPPEQEEGETKAAGVVATTKDAAPVQQE